MAWNKPNIPSTITCDCGISLFYYYYLAPNAFCVKRTVNFEGSNLVECYLKGTFLRTRHQVDVNSRPFNNKVMIASGGVAANADGYGDGGTLFYRDGPRRTLRANKPEAIRCQILPLEPYVTAWSAIYTKFDWWQSHYLCRQYPRLLRRYPLISIPRHNILLLSLPGHKHPVSPRAAKFAKTKVITDASGLWATMQKHDVGWIGIKPFASGSVFKSRGVPSSATKKEDDEVARMTLRYVLCNDALTAAIPGLITIDQVKNAARAVQERRECDKAEAERYKKVVDRMWANLPEGYDWLRDWEYV